MSRNRRSTKDKRPTAPRDLKRGDAYQNAVASVAKSMAPAAKIEVGVWTDGPDGRRDLDVVIRHESVTSAPQVVIECKDWNRPIGIAFIDALESKRRDINASVAMICSNSGYTADALHKAARVGIPAMTALIEGDNRIRVVVREQIYVPIVQFLHHIPSFFHQPLSHETKKGDVYTREYTYQGKSLESWVAAKLLNIAVRATSSRSFIARYRFRVPIICELRSMMLVVNKIQIRAAFTVQWMTQVAEIGASEGMYDYLRKVVVVGPGYHQYHLKNVDSETWGTPVDIKDVPPRWLAPPVDPGVPSMGMRLRMVKNMPQSEPKDAPDIDRFIEREEIVEDPR